MKKGKILLVMLAILLALGMVMSCGDLGNKEPTDPKPPAGGNDKDDDVVPAWAIGVYISDTSTPNVKETIKFGGNIFNITWGDTSDFLNFTITKWEDISEIPANVAGLLNADADDVGAFKFTGKIMSQKGYVPSTYTVPGGVATDVDAEGKGPDFTMYLYFVAKLKTGVNPDAADFDEDDSSNYTLTFVRTSFSKDGSNKNIVESSSKTRIYVEK